ncbi:uncharacterized protein K460DRAFT_371190 [Cucurbitaria berberidis CBS 394.84]|uniref:Uncharacterized protein n=1 Tax=Cucurbitaria berberidis CBS 394.84 TaxID=1168544 RepID=A0A9P4G9I4_9PLEO|nr:uncharacterized protein K460DRAFT_371190 [Cucurbitaria berberidis CBS 394.84]KAF1841180.1 hypothetical protein K460DRAFT_371190 [Cucurbitaria berberidis CBS 394.84]
MQTKALGPFLANHHRRPSTRGKPAAVDGPRDNGEGLNEGREEKRVSGRLNTPSGQHHTRAQQPQQPRLPLPALRDAINHTHTHTHTHGSPVYTARRLWLSAAPNNAIVEQGPQHRQKNTLQLPKLREHSQLSSSQPSPLPSKPSALPPSPGIASIRSVSLLLLLLLLPRRRPSHLPPISRASPPSSTHFFPLPLFAALTSASTNNPTSSTTTLCEILSQADAFAHIDPSLPNSQFPTVN